MMNYIKKHKKLTIFAILLLTGWWGWNSYKVSHYTGLMPAKFELDGVMLIDGDCGVAAFYLSGKTLADVQNEGLAFFDGEVIARNPKENMNSNYSKWKETPLPKEEYADGFPFPGMGSKCSKLDDTWRGKMYDATKQLGSYYAFVKGGEGTTLVVYPSLKIIVLHHIG